jgi:putative ABC transport system substrate-binding protein
MRRRDFVAGLGSAAAWPFAARAQQAAPPVIGYLNTGSPALVADNLQSFHHGLSETGFVDGRNVTIEYRWANDQYDQLPIFAGELVSHQVAVIVAGSNNSAKVAQAATDDIPIVFYVGIDPVEDGLVASLSRPGHNLTGVATLNHRARTEAT